MGTLVIKYIKTYFDYENTNGSHFEDNLKALL